MRRSDGSLVCSCPGHTNRGDCKHVKMSIPHEPKKEPNKVDRTIQTKRKDGPVARQGQYQEGIIRERDSSFEDDVVEGRITSGVARETDEVVELKDVSPTVGIDPDSIDEYDEDEIARKAAEASAQFQKHYLEWQDGYAVCTSCPHQHTIPIDPSKFELKDGKVLAKPPKPNVK